MANPLFQELNGNVQSAMPGAGMSRFGNLKQITGMIQKFMQFRRAFKGDAQEQVKMLLDTGKITQEELDDVMGVANQIMQMIPIFKRFRG